MKLLIVATNAQPDPSCCGAEIVKGMVACVEQVKALWHDRCTVPIRLLYARVLPKHTQWVDEHNAPIPPIFSGELIMPRGMLKPSGLYCRGGER